MGSYNVACSISNVSIGCGDPVYFIPLSPSKFASNKQGLHFAGHMLIYAYCYYNPTCLPIKGIYDDYGGVEEIEKDANTESIEKLFGMTIEEFMECATCYREPWNYYSELHGKVINLPGLADYSIKFNADYMKAIGFNQVDTHLFTHPHKKFPHIVKFIGDFGIDAYKCFFKGIGYEISDEHGKVVKSRKAYDNKSNILQDFLDLSGHYLGVKEDDQWKVKDLRNMSGMFIHGEIYDTLCQGKEKKEWNDVTHSELHDKLQQEIINWDVDDEIIITYAKSEAEQRERWELMVRIDKMLNMKQKPFKAIPKGTEIKTPKKYYSMNEPLRHNSDEGFHAFYRDWPYFRELYRESIKQGTLREAFNKFHKFYWAMYSANRFFFPAMNGEQCGNTEASIRLLLATQGILTDRAMEEIREGDSENKYLKNYIVDA